MLNIKNSQINKAFERLLLLFIFVTFVVAMNYTTHHVGGAGLFNAFNNTTWMGLTLLLAVAAIGIAIRGQINVSLVFICYLICFCLLILPLSYSPKELASDEIMTLLAVIVLVTVIFVFQQKYSEGFLRRALILLYLSSALQTAWGLLQYYFIFEPSLLFFRADFGIPYGTFAQKNVFSTYLSFGSLLAIYFLFTARSHSKLALMTTFIIVIANAHLSMLVDGRTGRVVPLIAIAMYAFYFAWKKQKVALASSIVLVALVFSFMPRVWFDVRPDQVAEAPLGIKSFGARPFMYKLGAKLALDRPLQGHGLGALPYLFKLKQMEVEKDKNPFAGGESIVDHIHNEPLQWTIALGLVSGFAFVGLFIVWCIGLRKGWLEPSIFLLALPFMGHLLLEYPFYHSAPHLLAFAIIMGLSVRTNKSAKTICFSPVLIGLVIPLVCFLVYQSVSFFTRSLASSEALVKYRMGNEQDVSILYSVEPTHTFEPFFTHEKFEWKLKEGMQSGSVSQETVFGFIDFLEKRRKQMPESLLYIQLAELYTIARQREKAHEVMLEARLLFPMNEKVQAYFVN